MDQVQTQEEVEMEHASAAYSAVEQALKKERKLETLLKEVHHDAEDADGILDNYASAEIGEDLEKRREESVSELSHSLEEKIQSKWKAAKEEELLAREMEEDAWDSLEQLKENEDHLKATLEELKAFTKKENEQKQR